jgi:hypothetical protein
LSWSWCDGCILENSFGLSTGETIVATMGLIQEHNDHITYEHILWRISLLSDDVSACDWMFDKSKSFKHGVSYFIVFIQWWSMCLYLISISSNDENQFIYISYPYQAMMMINIYISHIFIKQWWWSTCLFLLSISCNNDDDKCVYISYLYPAMMMINVSISHIHI